MTPSAILLKQITCPRLRRLWRPHVNAIADWSHTASIVELLTWLATDAKLADRIPPNLNRIIMDTVAKHEAFQQPLPDHEPWDGQSFRDDFYRAANSIPPAPEFPRERGIVICAGGWRFFPSLYVTLSMIRRSGCELPIQVWYLGDRGEFAPAMADMCEAFDVEWIDADAFVREHPRWKMPRLDGWECKALAAAACPFRQVFSLDADAYPTRDPSEWLDESPFVRHGACFFSDSPASAAHNQLKPHQWHAFGLPMRDEPMWESGQFAVDKSRHWEPMWLAWWINTRSRFVYSIIYGDKDTFHVAFRKTQHRTWVSYTPKWAKVAFIHLDQSKQPLIVHRCRDKFRYPWINDFMTRQTFNNDVHEQLPLETEAHAAYAECLAKSEPYRELTRAGASPGLLIIGPARGFTTPVHEICAKALRIKSDTHAGEVLNHQWNPAAPADHYSNHPTVKARCAEILDQHRGLVVKDVSQPAAVIEYLRQRRSDWRVLHIRRDSADVERLQIAKWGQDKPQPDPREWEQAYLDAADLVLSYDDVISNPAVLFGGLEVLGFHPKRFNYIDEAFQKKRHEVELSLA